MAVIFSDTFTEAANTGLLSHTPDIGNGWSVLYNTTGLADPFLVVAASGSLEGGGDVNSAGAGVATDPAPTGPEYDIQLTLVKGEGLPETGTKPMGIFARAVDANNGYVWAHYPNSHSNNAENIYIVQSGTRTLLASADYPETIPTTYKFEIRDAAKTLYIDGAEFISTTDNTITAAGKCGIFNGGGWGDSGHFRSVWQWDDFSLEMVGAPSPVVPLNAIGAQAAALGSTAWTTGGAATVNLNRLSLAVAAAQSDIQSDMFVSLAVVSAGLTAQTVKPIDATNVIVNLGVLEAQTETLAVAPYVPQDVIVGLDRLALAAKAVSVPLRDVQPTFRMFIDWHGDGFSGPFDEVTQFVQSADISIGNFDPIGNVAAVGEAVITLDNLDRRFSPSNIDSPYYGYLVPHVPVQIVASHQDWKQDYVLFTGRIKTITPDSQRYGSRLVTITCDDNLGVLQDNNTLSLPLRFNQTPQEMLKLICSATFGGETARATLRMQSAAAPNDTIRVGNRTYRFVNTLSQPYDIQRSTYIHVNNDRLSAAINGGPGAGSLYHASTIRHPDVVYERPPTHIISVPATIATSTNQAQVGQGGLIATAQSLVMPFQGVISAVRVWIVTAATNPAVYPLRIYIQPDEDGHPANNTGTWGGAVISSATSGSYVLVPFSTSATLAQGTKVWLVFLSDAPGPSQDWRLYASQDVIPGGQIKTTDQGWPTATWYTPFGGSDLRLDIYITPTGQFKALTEGSWANNTPIVPSNPSWFVRNHLGVLDSKMTGGADAPAGKLDFSNDSKTFDVVGGEWIAGETNAMTAVEEVVNSAGGYFWVARDGTLTYRNLEWFLQRAAQPPDLVIDNSANFVWGEMSIYDVVNVVNTTILDRRGIVSGIIAEGPEIIAVPGRWGEEPVERWTKDAPAEPGTITLRLPYLNPDTGKYMPALSVQVPVEGTDYEVNDAQDFTGFDYTGHGLITMSIVPYGGDMEVTISNSALGTLYIRNLVVRGRRFSESSEVTITAEDSDSIAKYGRRSPYTLNLPFTVSLEFARSLANYHLSRRSTPVYRANEITFENPLPVGGIPLYSLEIGDKLAVQEYQTADTQEYVIMGIGYTLQADGFTSIRFAVRPVEDKTYWVLGHETLGMLNQTTRLGV